MQKQRQRLQCSASVDPFRCCHDAWHATTICKSSEAKGADEQPRGRPAFPRKNSSGRTGPPPRLCARIIELAGLRPARTLLAALGAIGVETWSPVPLKSQVTAHAAATYARRDCAYTLAGMGRKRTMVARRAVLIAAPLAGLFALGGRASGQEFPTGPIPFVLPSPPRPTIDPLLPHMPPQLQHRPP